MRVGAVLPQTDFGTSISEIRQFVLDVAELGFSHLRISDHVVGFDLAGLGLSGPYSIEDGFHEPLVLMGYLAATCDLELMTAVLVTPQRPVVLVAKQAAEVDILTNGRFRLGIGVGWNRAEYEALGADFSSRGEHIEEQVNVLRALWESDVVDLPAHKLRLAGLRPRSIQRPIPIWMGGGATAKVLDRIGRMADGWLPQDECPDERFLERWARIQSSAAAAGRSTQAVRLEPRLQTPGRSSRELAALAEQWETVGASHLGCSTVGSDLSSIRAHVGELRRVSQILGLG